MYLSAAILGRHTVTVLTDRQHAAVLTIGQDTFTRADLAGIGCFNFQAAANLTRLLTVELRVKDTRDLFDRIPPEALVLPHLGAVSLAVLGAAFEAKGIGGDAPLEHWYHKHRNGAVVTFDTLKAHEKNAHRPPRAARSRGPRRK